MDHISTGEPFLLGMAALGAAKLSVPVVAGLGTAGSWVASGSWGQRSWRRCGGTPSLQTALALG